MTNYIFNFPNGTGGPDTFLVNLATEIPLFPIAILIFVWALFAIFGSTQQLLRKGYADIPLWSTLGFLAADFLALIMSTVSGIINPIVLSVFLALTFFSGLWLFLTRGRYEQ